MFATRSIGWRGSLSHDGYDNNVLRITGSVLRRIIDSAPIIAQGGFDAGRLRAQSESRKLAGPAMQTTAGHNSGLPATIADPAELRRRCRAGRFDGLTAGQAPGRVQANLMVVPRAQAYDLAVFCQRNPKPCPLLDITDPGDPEPRAIAPGADVRSDLPRYRVFRHGEMVDEPTDVTDLWRDDLVAFLIGCSFTFEDALIGAGLPLRHIEEGVNVPMYRTRRACAAAGGFAGPMVVSMRPMTPAQAEAAIAVTRPYQRVHGAPVHVGDPALLGIADLDRPDYGDRVTVRPGETPVFWACGVTPQAAVLNARPEIAISHAPGHMFVSDLASETLLD